MTTETVIFDTDDLTLLVYAAKAFALGLTMKRDVEPEVVDRLDLACRRVGASVQAEGFTDL